MQTSKKFTLTMLVLGGAAGLALAAPSLLDFRAGVQHTLPASVIARVGNHDIPYSRYVELLSDLRADKRVPLEEQDRDFVLSRLIDEELLIQRGMELNFTENSPEVRKSLAAAVIAQVVAEQSAQAPDAAELKAFYDSEADFFSTTGRYRVRWWRVSGSGEESLEQAEVATRLLKQGLPLEEINATTGLELQGFLPDQLLPLSKLADYMGPQLVKELVQLNAGELSGPLSAGGNVHVLQLEEVQAGTLPEFESIRPQVEAEFMRRRGDQALREYLGWLRQRTDIIVASERPE